MGRAGLPRRRVLAALALAPLATAGCGLLGPLPDDGPDPLIALADAARADADLADALAAADPGAAERVGPLAAARREHAAALDAEVLRLDPDRGVGPVAPPPTAVTTVSALADVLGASGAAAADVALGLPVERIGLVASVAACCSTYAALLAEEAG
jgi:predicted small lipoprotein YifL